LIQRDIQATTSNHNNGVASILEDEAIGHLMIAAIPWSTAKITTTSARIQATTAGTASVIGIKANEGNREHETSCWGC
jgi:hypothetical protein